VLLQALFFDNIKTKGDLNANVTTTGSDRGMAIDDLMVNNIADGVVIDARSGEIDRLDFNNWNSGALLADSIDDFRGAGDFGATLDVFDVAGNRESVDDIKIGGRITTPGAWNINGNVDSINANGSNADWQLIVTGYVDDINFGDADIDGVLLQALFFDNIKTKGDLNANVTTTGADRGMAIDDLMVNNIADGVVIDARSGMIDKLKLVAWEDGELLADTIDDLEAAGNFSATTRVLGTLVDVDDTVLDDVKIGGQANGKWIVDGRTDRFEANSVGDDFSAGFNGLLDRFDIDNDAAGDLAAQTAGDVMIGGNLNNARYLFGANFGDDATPGGDGSGGDTFGGGTVDRFDVDGNVNNSLVAVGLVPIGDVLNDFDAAATIFAGGDGPQANLFDRLVIGGVPDAGSRFIAGLFPTRTEVAGERFDPADEANNPFADNFRVNP
jgi:hypothetical protein